MIGQIIATVFIVWFFIGLILISIGSFINNCTKHITDIDEIGRYILEVLLDVFLISILVGLIILIWR